MSTEHRTPTDWIRTAGRAAQAVPRAAPRGRIRGPRATRGTRGARPIPRRSRRGDHRRRDVGPHGRRRRIDGRAAEARRRGELRRRVRHHRRRRRGGARHRRQQHARRPDRLRGRHGRRVDDRRAATVLGLRPVRAGGPLAGRRQLPADPAGERHQRRDHRTRPDRQCDCAATQGFWMLDLVPQPSPRRGLALRVRVVGAGVGAQRRRAGRCGRGRFRDATAGEPGGHRRPWRRTDI